jgi:hypothetical protein
MNTHKTSTFKDPNGANHLSHLHDRYVVVPADKNPNYIVCAYKSHTIDCFINELGISNSLDNSTYTPTTHAKEDILDNPRPALCSFGISIKNEELDVRRCTGFLNYTSILTNNVILLGLLNALQNLSKLITYILSIAKTGLLSYSDTSYSRDGVN